MDTLALVTTYRATGHHAAESSGAAFTPISPRAPGSTVDEYPIYWISAIDVLSTAAARTIVGVSARPDRIKWTAPFDETRRAVNEWMRTRAGFDAAIDFDRLMSDGAVYESVQSLKPAFACDDNLHPNAAAYRAMAEFVDLDLFGDRHAR